MKLIKLDILTKHIYYQNNLQKLIAIDRFPRKYIKSKYSAAFLNGTQMTLIPVQAT